MSPLAVFFLKFGILLAGVYIIILLTPKIAALIDQHKKPGETLPEAPRPERVQDDINSENGGISAEKNTESNENNDMGENQNG